MLDGCSKRNLVIKSLYNLLYKCVVAKLGSKAGNQTQSREFLIWKERGGRGEGRETEIGR
jgi:hypothetical protein